MVSTAAHPSADGDSPTDRSALRGRLIQFRYRGIWYMIAVLTVLSALAAPASLKPTSLFAVLPFVAFLAVASMGESLVMMVGGLDVSIPAVIGLVAVTLVAVTGGSNPNVSLALLVVLAMAAGVGLINGVLVSVLQLNPLLVTLSVNTVLTGGMLFYLQTMRFESRVAASLEQFGSINLRGVNVSVFVALALMLLITLFLDYTPLGRRFRAVGANPASGWIAGIAVRRYQVGAYVVAALLYAMASILLCAFMVTPNKDVGLPYFLAPIAAVILGTGSLAGGMGSMVATVGGAFFYTQLGQVLKTMGMSGYAEYILLGAAIGGGMAVTNPRFVEWLRTGLRTIARRSST
ncbi:MAG: ABC transporter permease [Anaerolineae bacterium]|nr:ABC transporter permease [Anaerolineae bacterium]